MQECKFTCYVYAVDASEEAFNFPSGIGTMQ